MNPEQPPVKVSLREIGVLVSASGRHCVWRAGSAHCHDGGWVRQGGAMGWMLLSL